MADDDWQIRLVPKANTSRADDALYNQWTVGYGTGGHN
ncbi:hypothetical protein MUK42_21279 [Musa troglodytarum]|uniref:Uncharacterized protein n=1 Tax=Musa troglodytarum TaxID=320322 RepID=A0A9E7I0P4_9LILI|nr:hypothetical protein MUK42_21279 [Musa troglodytarum]